MQCQKKNQFFSNTFYALCPSKMKKKNEIMVVVVVMIGGPVVATLSQLFLFTRGEGSVSRGGGAGRFARTHTHIHRLLMASSSFIPWVSKPS